MQQRAKRRPLFWAILMPQFFVLALMTLVLTASFPIGGMGEKITRNYRNVVALQTANQVDYLESYMADNWSQLSILSQSATQILQAELDGGSIHIEQLDSDRSCYEPLLLSISDKLLSTVASNHVSGAFVILNTDDLDAAEGRLEKPCLYLRDLDPGTISPSNEDILIFRSTDRVCRSLNLNKAESYQQSFGFYDPVGQAFFYETFQRAYLASLTGSGAAAAPYWTSQPYSLEGDNSIAMAYCIPLILSDGTVVGVMGVELLLDQIHHFLPSGQLLESDESTYLIACSLEAEPTELYLIANGGAHFLTAAAGDKLKLTPLQIGGYGLMCGEREFFAELSPMNPPVVTSEGPSLYWYLVGVVGMNEMFSFTHEMSNMTILTLTLMLLVGIVSSITVSRRLSRPISVLAAEVEQARSSKNGSTAFTDTGIEEIDTLSASFHELMQETVDTSTKFLRIMDMASVEIAGYEWRDGSDSIYVTDNFFPMLGMDDIDPDSLTAKTFTEHIRRIRSKMGASITLDGSRIYCISRDGRTRYVRAESSQVNEHHVGLLEDVTRTTLERIRIEHERDYDVLTGLYNRRAFYHRAVDLFNEPKELRTGALVIMDSDGLKTTNDRFGHDWGDKYLRHIAQILQENIPNNTLCARISGDEFYIFFHGFSGKDDLLAAIDHVMDAIRNATLTLPDGEATSLSVSAGIAVFPEDSKHLPDLVKYADFAMYQAKSISKGSAMLFDAEEYAKNERFLRGRGELRELIERENVDYHFQPIFSSQTSRPAAYEALMRVNMPSIKSPDVVLRLAAAENSQYQIERITMFKAAETFRQLLQSDQVSGDAMLFINSMPDQCLTDEDAQAFHERFSALQSRIVLEITEDEYLGLEALEVKRNYPGFSGNFALDDYGSGYNGEKNLLLLQPRFVKVDVVFIRGIDSNPDRQQLVSSLVTYAHGRGMQVVAEGIETAEELKKVLELGVDLLQGYFLARPAAVPGTIAPQAEEIIKKYHKAS